MPVASTQPVYPPPPGMAIEAEWGIAASEGVIQRFTSISDRDLKWTAPIPTGAKCVTTTPLLVEWIYDGVTWVPAGGVLIGEMKLWPVATVPANWLLCDGAAVSRSTYAYLFAVLGTTWGAGNGTTTFNVPDMRGRVGVGLDNMGGTDAGRLTGANTLGLTGGEEAHFLVLAEMPWHTHDQNTDMAGGTPGHSGAGTVGANGGLTGPYSDSGIDTGAAGGSGAHNNMQPYALINYLIYAGA